MIITKNHSTFFLIEEHIRRLIEYMSTINWNNYSLFFSIKNEYIEFEYGGEHEFNNIKIISEYEYDVNHLNKVKDIKKLFNMTLRNIKYLKIFFYKNIENRKRIYTPNPKSYIENKIRKVLEDIKINNQLFNN